MKRMGEDEEQKRFDFTWLKNYTWDSLYMAVQV